MSSNNEKTKESNKEDIKICLDLMHELRLCLDSIECILEKNPDRAEAFRNMLYQTHYVFRIIIEVTNTIDTMQNIITKRH